MASRLIRLRYAGTCAGCARALPAGTKAWWDPGGRTATCSACQSAEAAAPAGVVTSEPAVDPAVSDAAQGSAPAPFSTGEAGVSARREYERRHQRREARIEQEWGRLSGVVKFLSNDPQSTRAWAKGSEGEQRLAWRLTRDVGDRAVLLHDRKVPGTRGNIDHLAVAASGIWVIDAKNYDGRVEQRDVGGWFRTDLRLYVGGRDRTKAAEGLGWQVDAVRKALDGAQLAVSGAVPVHAALCFIEADWKLFAKPFSQGGVWVTWGKKLVEMIAAPGPLSTDEVMALAGHLANVLPPAVR